MLTEAVLLVDIRHEPQRRLRSGDEAQMSGSVAIENDHAA